MVQKKRLQQPRCRITGLGPSGRPPGAGRQDHHHRHRPGRCGCGFAFKLLPAFATTIRRFKLQLEQNIPLWLLQLQIADEVLDAWNTRTQTMSDTTAAEEENKLLLAVIKTLNVSDQRHQAYSELATRCLYYLNGGANGKLDWQDCSDLVEEYYTNFVKGKIT